MRLLDAVADFIEERTGLRSATARWLDHPAVGGSRWVSALAASVATCVAVLALTGVVLMTAYSPAPQSAWASVHYIQFVLDRGWILRGLHYWAAQALIVLAAVHVLHGALTAAYGRPREIGWLLTLLVLGLALAEGITGGLLPWDQRGWWARVVEGNIVGLAPVVGAWIEEMISGGTELGALGLGRAFTAHVILLPLVLGLALRARRALAVRHGWSAAPVTESYARQVGRNALVAVAVVFAVFALTGWARGGPLEAPADGMSDYPARPEWYLMPLFQLRKFFHGPAEFWGTTLVPAAAGAFLVLLPWIDGRLGRPRTWVSCALTIAPAVAIFVTAAAFAATAMRKDARDKQYLKARAKADAQAVAAIALAKGGVPPEGALFMVRHDPELHGQEVFEKRCASCHVLGSLGDPEKATATKLDGWTTPQWIEAMIHDPDGPEFFGRGPYKGQMQSVDVRPKDTPAGEPWTPIIKSEQEKRAVALFLASLGDEPGDPPRAMDDATKELGEKIVSERCTTCHLYKGDGDEEGSDVAPELARYGSVAWTRSQVADPSSADTYRKKALDPKMKKHMPRFDKELSAEDVDVVARWTRAHARGLPVR